MGVRADKLAAAVAEQDLDALLVIHPPNLRWTTGFSGTNGACLVGPDVRLFFTDFRYVERAASEVDGFDQERAGRDLLADIAGRMKGRVGFDDATISVRTHKRLIEAAGAAELVPAGGLVEALREVKDEAEVAAMRAAAEIADQAYRDLADQGVRGRTERELATWLEFRMRELGAQDRSFPPIVASGAQGAQPHAESRDAPVERDALMVVDMGCVVDEYCSDCTRTFATGTLDDEARAVYDLVQRAQAAALEAVRAGAECRAVDSVARDLIAAEGHGEHFGHGLGHGVGIEVHEGPRLAQTVEGTLEAGNAVTVEPGVYLPGKLGVRIEDLVVVTDSGCEILTGFSKALTTLP